MKKAISLICIVVIVVSLAGCVSDEDKLVGSWYSVDNESLCLVFYENGKGKAFFDGEAASTMGYWAIEDGKLNVDGQRVSYDISGNTLTITVNGESAVYKKK